MGNFYIGTGKIKGIEKDAYFFKDKCFYAWNISFYATSTLLFNNIPFIYLAEHLPEANQAIEKLRNNFELAGIHEDDKVAVIFKYNGDVIAISLTGSNKWVDVRDKLSVKTFKELKLDITDITVY